MSKILIFVSSHRRHNKVSDRLIGALAAHRKIELFSFDRGFVEHPVYSDPGISHTSLGPISDGVGFSRIAAFTRAFWILWRTTRRMNEPDSIVIANTLELLLISWLSGLTRWPTVYDVLDIHVLLLSRSLTGRIARWLERQASKRVQLLVVSSPWFYWEYFAKRLKVQMPALLIENKVRSMSARPASEPKFSRKIAWNGLLRCQLSASVLIECLTADPGALQLSLHGTLDRLGDMGPRLLAKSACTCTGPYEPESLSSLLRESSFVWAVDFADGDNSAWLLPNRLYEATAAGIPLIAVSGTATGDVVGFYDLGIVLAECTPEMLMRALECCSAETYRRWVGNVSELQVRAARGQEWELVFADARRWTGLRHLPEEINAGLVLQPDVFAASVNRQGA